MVYFKVFAKEGEVVTDKRRGVSRCEKYRASRQMSIHVRWEVDALNEKS